ncbi:hypothetical protein [Pseudomonas sp. PA15(2017)]|uniref:hypothetical protein n=1 Tax=Pseudomonas sp. PA15(2017) TaxID=1932111 RepID=UPI00211552E6|nr:hypothetical protein [Pseudomonas sp. PA15(2017)]
MNDLEIASDIGLSESLLSNWFIHSRPYADGSDYRVFFNVETPGEVRRLLLRITPTTMLIVLGR